MDYPIYRPVVDGARNILGGNLDVAKIKKLKKLFNLCVNLRKMQKNTTRCFSKKNVHYF